MQLVIVAALLVVTGSVVVIVCCWPALFARRRGVRVAPAAGPEPPARPKRSDFTLTS